MRYKKLDIALIQFESAINAYFDKRYVEAITLAGAAEDIFGGMCLILNEKSALVSFIDYAQSKDKAIDYKKYKYWINSKRNLLKHHCITDEIFVEFEEIDVELMLVRATVNYLRLGLNPTPLTIKFIEHVVNI